MSMSNKVAEMLRNTQPKLLSNIDYNTQKVPFEMCLGQRPHRPSPYMTATSSGTQGKNGLLSVHQRLRGAAWGAKYQREGGDMG